MLLTNLWGEIQRELRTICQVQCTYQVLCKELDNFRKYERSEQKKILDKQYFLLSTSLLYYTHTHSLSLSLSLLCSPREQQKPWEKVRVKTWKQMVVSSDSMIILKQKALTFTNFTLNQHIPLHLCFSGGTSEQRYGGQNEYSKCEDNVRLDLTGAEWVLIIMVILNKNILRSRHGKNICKNMTRSWYT